MNKYIQTSLNDYARPLEKELSLEEQKKLIADSAKRIGYLIDLRKQEGWGI